jgi:hypothetical protein
MKARIKALLNSLPEGRRKPRDWQGVALAAYSNNTTKNFCIVACPASGKTSAMILCGAHSVAIGEASLMIVLVTNGHLQNSFVEDARKLGVNLIEYSNSEIDILNRTEIGYPGAPRGTKITSLLQLKQQGYHGIVMPVHILASDRYWHDLRAQMARLPNGVVLGIDEIHHYGDRLEKKENDETPAFTNGVINVFTDDITSRRILGTGTPFRTDPRGILSKWIDYTDAQEERIQADGTSKIVEGKKMKVMADGHVFKDICDRDIAVVNKHGVVVSYGEHAVPMGWCPEVKFILDDYKHNWDEEISLKSADSETPEIPGLLVTNDGDVQLREYRDVTWAMCDAATKERENLLNGCKYSAVKPGSGFVRDRINKINDAITKDRHKGFEPRPDSACLVVVPGGGPNSNPEADANSNDALFNVTAQYADVIKQETGEDAWVIVGDMSRCRAGRIANPLGKTINGQTITQPSDLIKAFENCSDRYVITQKMIAEGATILRLDHVFYCGTDLTEMFLWQVLGRVLRMYPEGTRSKVAYFWSYNHPIIRLWAKNIKDMLDKLKKEEKQPQEGPEPGERKRRIIHNCSHDADYEIWDGKEFEGERLGVIKHWLAAMQSSMPLDQAENFLRENNLWEAACQSYRDDRSAQCDESESKCVVNAVLPSQLGDDWRELPLSTRIKVLKEVLRRIYSTIYWKDQFGETDYATIDREDPMRERVFKRASAAYRRRFSSIQSDAVQSGLALDVVLYPAVQEQVKSLKAKHSICHTTLSYKFPANA